MNNPNDLNLLIADDVYHQGWSVQTHYFDIALIRSLAKDAQRRYQAGRMRSAGIGRGSRQQLNSEVRKDVIQWLNYDDPAQLKYQWHMEALRQTLNQTLMLGLFEFEAHYAVYAPGAFYKKHLDSFQGQANRVVSTVTYLNEAWPEEAGGELCLFAPESEDVIGTVRPFAGTLAVFLSEKIPHAVNAAQQQRLSIAGWFRINSV